MNSLDTHILVYAFNSSCTEHVRARTVLESLVAHPDDWIVADQVLIEFYRAIRNPSILAHPLSAADAYLRVAFVEQSGCARCGWDHDLWKLLRVDMAQKSFPSRRVFDRALAHTLRAQGVDRFYTRNVRDFADAGFAEVLNPIDR